MRQLVISVAAGLALVGANLAAAQAPERREGPHSGATPGRSVQPRANPSPGQVYRQSPRVPEGSRAEPRLQPRQQQGAGRDEMRGGAAGPERSRAERRVMERERNAVREHPGQGRAAEERRRVGERQKSSERGRTAAGKQAELSQARYDELREARSRLTREQHQRLRAGFDPQRGRVAHAGFDWHVGHRVPRQVRLYPVPSDVIAIFPYYRDYSYFVVGEEICIVDPHTYEVVDVIDEGYPIPRLQTARLSLSAAQIAVVRDSIPRDVPETSIHVRLALGAEIPDDVMLHEFPAIVLDRAPRLQDYRFLLAADEIVIVDPRDRSIALVIDRT
jgi:Protein of unknown function (DUF1236)